MEFGGSSNSSPETRVEFRDYPRLFPATAAEMMEAIELLAWLAWVSVSDFHRVLGTLWPDTHHMSARFRLPWQRVGIELRAEWHGHEVSQACFTPRLGLINLPPAYAATRNDFEQAAQARGQLDSNNRTRPEIPCHVYLGGPDDKHNTMAELLMNLPESDRTGVPRTFDVRIIKAEYACYPVRSTPSLLMAHFAELRMRGAEIMSCWHPDIDLGDHTRAEENTRGLQALLQTQETTGSGSGINALWLQLDRIPANVAPALFTAIAARRSLRKIHFISLTTPTGTGCRLQARRRRGSRSPGEIYRRTGGHDPGHVAVPRQTHRGCRSPDIVQLITVRLVAMLDRNDRLVTCNAAFIGTISNHEAIRTERRALDAHHRKLLPCSFTLRHKLAFLSAVVTSRSDGRGHLSLGQRNDQHHFRLHGQAHTAQDWRRGTVFVALKTLQKRQDRI